MGGGEAVPANTSMASDPALLEAAIAELDEAGAWTESFLVLDRDGVFTVDQTDEPTLSRDAPLSDPH